jgi:nicotinamidase-related amidase
VNNPARGKESETKPQQLWPEHCVAESPGAEIIPEMNTTLADLIVHKGMRAEVEMYSVFADSFGNCDPGTNCHSVSLDVAARLRDESITDVFVVGLAGDYCVKETAVDAIKAGFRSWVIEEGTKCVMPDSWKGVEDELKKAGVAVVSVHDPVIEGL